MIYSQIALKIMRWHQVFRTKQKHPKKWMKKPNQYQKKSKLDEIAKFEWKEYIAIDVKHFYLKRWVLIDIGLYASPIMIHLNLIL
jgi:hypothetical protein